MSEKKPNEEKDPKCSGKGKEPILQHKKEQEAQLANLYKKTAMSEEYIVAYFRARKEISRAHFFHYLFKGYTFNLACQSAGLDPQSIIDELSESISRFSQVDTTAIIKYKVPPLDTDIRLIFAVYYSIVIGDLHSKYRKCIETEKGNSWQKYAYLISSLPSVTEIAGLKEETLNLGDPGAITIEELAKEESSIAGLYEPQKDPKK